MLTLLFKNGSFRFRDSRQNGKKIVKVILTWVSWVMCEENAKNTEKNVFFLCLSMFWHKINDFEKLERKKKYSHNLKNH